MLEREWVNFEEAIQQAKDMVTTLYLTIKTKKVTHNFLVEVHGIEQMAVLHAMLDKLKRNKKVISWDAKNLALLRSFDMDSFKTLIGKI